MERVATGITWFDAQINEGLPKNKVTVIAGETGIGKTIFGLQFLRTGLFTDEKVAYFTSKESMPRIMQTFSELDWDINWAIEQGRLFVVDFRNYFVNVEDDDLNSALLSNFLKEIQSVLEQYEIKRCVFDPVIPFILQQFPDVEYRFVSQLVSFLEELPQELTAMLIVNMEASRLSMVEQLAANVVSLYFSRFQDVFKRTLLIKKMQQTAFTPQALYFDIKAKEGFIQTA